MSETSNPTARTRTAADVQAGLQLRTAPDDEFMALLAEVGDADFVEGPPMARGGRAYTPEELEELVITGTVGDLLATARQESQRTLEDVGDQAGVTRARVQQIEHSSNIQIATLVRLADAMGYRVGISLAPKEGDRRPLFAELAVIPPP